MAGAEQGVSSGYYVGTFPTVASGYYNVVAKLQAGGSPAESDLTVGTGTVAWTGASVGEVNGVKRNQALNSFGFVMTDSTTHAPKPSLTVTATREIDGGAFAACANAPVEDAGGNGWYNLNLAASDLNGSVIKLRFTATGADDLDMTILTQP